MEIKSKEIKIVPINTLIPYEKNMHIHSDEQIDRLCELIRYQGFRSPLIVQKGTNRVACGHGRLMACKKLGIDKVPIVEQEFENEEQFYAFVVSENAIGKDTWAQLDLSQINTDIIDFGPELDIDMLGLKDFVVEPIEKLEPGSDEDSVPELKDEPITKKGDVWLLGNHRVMCGDSTMIDDVEKLMNGEKADMVFTDPPYGMKLNADYSKMGGTGLKHDNVKGDHDDFTEDLINTIFYFDHVKEMFIFGADYFAQLLPERNCGSWVVWDKRSNGENIGAMDKQFGSMFELCWSKNKHKREIARVLKETGVFASRGEDKPVHPTQKPIKLVEWFFDRWCKGLDICIDLYLGSGSTLIACEKTNRKCYGMELDEHYCDVIINRWQKYTNKEAILEGSGETYNSLKASKNE